MVVVSAAASAAAVAVGGWVVMARLRPVVHGQWPPAGRTVAHWTVDCERREWRVTSELGAVGAVTAWGPFAAWRHPTGEVVVRDVKTGPVTVSATARLDAAWILWPPGLEGTVKTTEHTINRQPVAELSGRWRLAPGRLILHTLTFGSRYRLSGSVGWLPPHPLAVTLDVREADAARVAAVIEPGKAPLAGGIVQGTVTVTGTTAAPRVRGALTARRGKLGATAFETADVQFEGEGTQLRFLETRLRQANAVVTVEGFLDVTKLGTPTVFQDMRLISQPLLTAASDDRLTVSRRTE